MPRIKLGSPDPQSSLLLLRHRGGPVKPRKSQTKSPLYYPLKLTPLNPPSNIFSLERRCWDTGRRRANTFLYIISVQIYDCMRFLREPNIVKDKIFFVRHNEIFLFRNDEIIIPLSQEKILLLRDNFLVKLT